MLAPVTLAALALVVLIAFTVETALGFGATVVTIALGSFLSPIETILPAFVPINMALSAYLAVRYRRDVDRRLLFRRIAPLMGLGLPIGMLIFRELASRSLQLAFGVFVVALSIVELSRMRRSDDATTPRGPGPIVSSFLLVVAGIIHGVFVTGGPLAVYVIGKELRDKARFRATLSALWFVLNIALLISYVASGRISGGSAATSAAFIVPLFAGMALGEKAHRRVPEALFRVLVFALLLVAGALLAVRAAGG